MRIFVTGGAGFIGSHLVKALAKKHIIRIYDNLSTGSKENISDLLKREVDFVESDILDYQKLVESSKEYDIVIHLAAISGVVESIGDQRQTNRVNVEGTQNVVNACVKNGINKIIFASSAAVYGNTTGNSVTEDTVAKPVSPYGKSKLEGEKIIKEIENNTSLRLFNVYGKNQNKNHSGVITKFLRRVESNNKVIVYGDGQQTRDFIFIDDVIKAMELALHVRQSRVYNIASGKAVSIREIIQKLSQIYKKEIAIEHKEERDGDIKDSSPSINKAKTEISFVPKISLDEGLRYLVSVSN